MESAQMAFNDIDIFASKPFTFIIEGKPLHVHAELIAECSEPFNRMINGYLAEAQQGSAQLQDVDELTFVRFIRWMYSGDYAAQKHTTAVDGLETEVDPATNVENDEWGFGGESSKRNMEKERKDEQGWFSIKKSFIHKQDDWEEFDSIPSFAPRSNRGPSEDYSEVFLSHARLYVFAEKYDIRPLRQLALKKLQQTLAVYTLYDERVEDVLALLRYVYANTLESIQGFENIRTILAHYIACEMGTLAKHGGIKELMLEHGEILGDFLDTFV